MAVFGKSSELSFGIEEEFFILKGSSLSPSVDLILNKVPRCLFSKKIVYHELHKSQIEINSGVCNNIDQAKLDLSYLRGLIHDAALSQGLSLIGTGTHPTADWKNSIINPQYVRNLSRREKMQAYLTCGTHIHIGVATEGRAVRTINVLKYYIPHLISVSANSPFELGKDTGLVDRRLCILEEAHTRKNRVYAGIPPTLKDVSSWEKYKDSEDIPMYWDIRPNTDYGTVEFRVCDSQPSIRNTLALACAIRIMCGQIIKRELGLPFMDDKELVKARNAAIKDGQRARFKDQTLSSCWKQQLLPHLKDHMGEYSFSYNDLAPLINIIHSGESPAEIQRKIFQKTRNLESVIRELSGLFMR